NVYSFNPEADNSQVALAPYSEHTALGLWLTGHNHAGNWAEKVRPLSVYDLKAAVENIFKRLGINERELLVEQTDNDVVTPALLYKNRGGKLLGMLGVVEEKLLKRFDIDQEVYFAQFNWNAICKMAAKNSVKYYDLPKTLPVKRDLALLVDTAVTYDDIRRVVEQSEKKLLKSMTLFDVYEGKNLPAGKKSYAISLILQDDAKTMQDKQIDAIMQKIIKNLETQVGAQLR
ncbi:MAG: phenylalanine--tRNA ligase subunit beta, partial [Muribaculaceae bacterium]|nr:phenylalanine--tRNA ligase subunit beta [Muribaculaceae bacterium]